MTTLDAIHLTQLGAQAGLVSQFTGIEKAVANRLHRQIHGRPSPPGQTPFTDHWFLKNDRRMLHAAVVWRLHRDIARRDGSPARRLIDLYKVYRLSVYAPFIDIVHAAFVPNLVDMGLWCEDRCGLCSLSHILPIEDHGKLCPGCRLYQRYRCPACGQPAEGMRKGRRHLRCSHCGRARIR
jgi:DNA-directed RNA polymerase subunit RPC12/RpoP